MASIKLVYGSSTETCWSSTSRITTPSLILNDNGTIRYTPLFSGNAGGTATSGNYRYTLGHLIVDGKRVALSQTRYKYYNSCTVEFFKENRTAKVTTGSGTSAVTTKHYYTDFYIKVKSKSIEYGAFQYICVNGGRSTTSTSSYTISRTIDNGTSSYTTENPAILFSTSQGTVSTTPTWHENTRSVTLTQKGTL